MRRKSNDVSLQEAMQLYLRQFHLEEAYIEARIKNNWQEIMGQLIASQTGNVSYKKGILTINVNIGVLKSELSHGKEQVKKLVNDFLGNDYIKDVNVF
jgi:hypothetical protein